MIGRTNTGGGGASKPEEEKSVALSMGSGDQVVLPTTGSVLTKVTITKPSTLLPENIKSGINIGGVVGSLVVSDVHPTLYTPSISKSGTTLYISNHSSNGGFVSGYKVYSGGSLLSTQSATSFSLASLNRGKYTITAKAYATGFNDSNASNPLAVTVYEFLKNIKNLTISEALSKTTDGQTVSFTISAASGYYRPTKIAVHCNGESLSFTYNPYTGAASLSALKATYSGSDTYALIAPTVALNGHSITVTDIKLATGIDLYDSDTKVGEETVTPEISDTTDLIMIDAAGVATPQLVKPTISLNGSTLTIVDSVIGSGNVTNATSYDLYDGDSVASNIAI